jgi:hypothetical protein
MRLDEKIQPKVANQSSNKIHQPQRNEQQKPATKATQHQPANKKKRHNDAGNAAMGNAFADAFAKLKK